MKRLTVADLVTAGAYVGAPVEKEISWNSKGKTHKALISVKLSSYETTLHEMRLGRENSEAVEGEEPKRDTNSVVINRLITSVVDEAGEPIFTRDDVVGNAELGKGKMCASLFMALVMAVNEANGYVEEDEKN